MSINDLLWSIFLSHGRHWRGAVAWRTFSMENINKVNDAIRKSWCSITGSIETAALRRRRVAKRIDFQYENEANIASNCLYEYVCLLVDFVTQELGSIFPLLMRHAEDEGEEEREAVLRPLINPAMSYDTTKLIFKWCEPNDVVISANSIAENHESEIL